ncbi:MAG: YkoF family thiamine/hydroxymethylpyrimidine-binding protein [Woeseiaceae bacterium]
MQVAVDISLYPLDKDIIPPILDVIGRLRNSPGLDVVTNPMSTQIRGDYDEVMTMLTRELKTTFEDLPKAVFVIKILNNPIAD